MPRSNDTLRLAACLSLLSACATAPSGPPPRAAAETLESRCTLGYPVACRDLGRAHLLGQGAAPDDRLAAAYATKACEMGEAAGCADLGVLSAIGRGVAQSDARAVALSRRACDGAFALACSNLGVMTVEGVNTLALRPDEAGEAGQKTVRWFRAACETGVPEGCLNLGSALEAGTLVPRDVPGAVRALRKACDGGLPLACYRLGLLATRSAEVPGEVSPAPLYATACAAAIAPACDLAGLPVPPPSVRTPTPRLVDEPRSLALGIPGAGGFHPTDLTPSSRGPRRAREEVRRPTEALLAAVPPELRGRLDLGGAPRPGDAGDPPVDLLVALRRHQLGSCYQAERKNPGVRTEVLVAFLVEADGSPAEVRAAAAPADPELETCAAEVVTGWEFPVPAGGLAGPYLVRFAFESAPAGSPPTLTPPGGLRPALKEPGCIERKLRVPPEFRGTVGGATVKLAVDGNGTPILFHAVTPAPEPLVAAIADAVRACEWVPGAEPSGRPSALWVTVQVKIDGR
ncbi:MAG: sel1 repeat family protein [Anaeromyxobacter sp.]|nr:sel1 repeat family protein [Anaeromyxobacter sp.]MBL0277113.1 sel1 repeat family protein [Anaeromyxobacter sp.]